MRQKRTRLPSATTSSHGLEAGADLLPPWPAAPANDTRVRTGRSKAGRPPQHPPAPHQDADWDNDATTLFQRNLEDGRWSGDLSSLLEPDAWPELEPRQRSVLEARPPAARAPDVTWTGPRRRVEPPIASMPPRASLEPSLGVEGSLQRSMRPRPSKLRAGLWFLVPMGIVLGADAIWAAHGGGLRVDTLRALWSSPMTAGPRASAAAPIAIDPEPRIESLPLEAAGPGDPATVPPTGAVAPQAARAPAPDSAHTPAPSRAAERRANRAARAAARRARRAERASAELARPILPMPDATPGAEREADAVEGVLQINSRPWARVMVDGRFVGHTPQRDLKLPEGRYQIHLENEPLEMSKTFEVTIEAGETVTRVVMLEEN